MGQILSGDNVAKSNIVSVTWNPITLNVVYHSYNSGVFTTTMGIFTYLNGPSIVFMASIIANVLLFALLKYNDKIHPD